MTLRMIDTFSGIGGFSLAARWLGEIETVQFVEREPFCQQILRKHWPDVPIHDDICTYQPAAGSADIICGGFPCQDISQAGKGAGLSGDRSGLFYELLRVVRLVGPRYIVLENVAAILGRGLDDVLGALAAAGYDAEWACIPASAVGACHRRDRWWCVAYPNHSRVEETRAEFKPAGPKQCRELGDSAHSLRKLRNGTELGEEMHKKPNESKQRPELRRGNCMDVNTDSHRQRQQECKSSTIATGAGQPAWPHAPQQLNPDWRGYLSQPVLRRGDDGLSGRVDRLKALGNAVVPQVAMIPLGRVLELEQQQKPPRRKPGGLLC